MLRRWPPDNIMPAPAVKIYRGSQLEASHDVSIAIVDSQGVLTHCYGDPTAVYMTRSAIKPFQLMPLILSGAADEYKFTLKQLAVMCGSHSGTDEHKVVVESNLKAAGNKTEYLQCGCHRPLGMVEQELYPLKGEDKDPTRHNCSGKHSGFLALAKFIGEKPEDYLKAGSQTQRLVKDAVASFCEYPLPEEFYGTDGCSAPNFPLPLKNLAFGFMKLAGEIGKDDAEIKAVRRIKQAMIHYPFMVSGENRLDFDLMRAFPDKIICKIGAEAVEGIGFADEKIGISVKIHDGANRALGPVVFEILIQLGLINSKNIPESLCQYTRAKIRNVRNIITGEIVCDFILKKC